jgi:hypothetical protein
MELGWRLELGFEGGIGIGMHGGRCTQAYIGVWEEYRRIKIRVRDKI